MTNLIPPGATADEGVTNDERADWAALGLLAFGRCTGMVARKIGDKEDPSLVVADLLADLAHWCDRNNVNLQSALERATWHYRTETGEEGRQLI